MSDARSESAVGAHLANAAAAGDCALYYWRERNREVDFVVLSVGGDGIPLEEFLAHPVAHWIEDFEAG